MDWPYGHDRTADCGCCWSARTHGDVCPEHGETGHVPTERDVEFQLLKAIAKAVSRQFRRSDGTGHEVNEALAAWHAWKERHVTA